MPDKIAEVNDILQVMHEIYGEGFENLQPVDVEEVLAANDSELTEQKLLEILESNKASDEDDTSQELTVDTEITSLSLTT